MATDYKGNFKKYLSVEFDKADTNRVRIYYRTFDNTGTELIKLKAKPSTVLLNDNPMIETKADEGYSWNSLEKGGVLTIRRKNGDRVLIIQ
jgi:hypothetical protein